MLIRLRYLVLCILVTGVVHLVFGQDIELPSVRNTSEHPMIPVLMNRQSTRSFSGAPLNMQIVSDLLWAAVGVNRPTSGKRTVNFSWDTRDVDIYLAAENGVFLYKALDHSLEQKSNEDIRALIDPAYKDAPLTLIFVSDYSRITQTTNKTFYAAIHTGFCAQNVYLFCSAENLGALVRSSGTSGYEAKLNLTTNQHIMLIQTIGHKTTTLVTRGNPKGVSPSFQEIFLGESSGPLPPARVDDSAILKTLKERRSTKVFASTTLSDQVLSEIVWSGFGVNRPASGKRTAPSAWDCKDIEIYLAMSSGVYVYKPQPPHLLQQISTQDIRGQMGSAYQNAPLTLIYVSNYSRLTNTSDKEKYSCFHTGLISQNVQAYCAAERIGQMVRSSGTSSLPPLLGLTADQHITVVQTIGYWANQPNNPSVSFSAGAGGTVTGSLNQSVSYGGTTSAITAVANPGFRFLNWSGAVGGILNSNPLTLRNVFCDMNIQANYVPTSSPSTQSFALISGWNWVSFNVLPTDLSLTAVFSNIVGQVQQLKAQTQSVIRSNNAWKGDLANMNGINQYKMFRLKVNAPCSLTVSGNQITATTAIPLQAGWNWVAYLPTPPLQISTALDSIKGQVLQVKSRTESATYSNGVWNGTLTHLEPGQGYAISMSGPGTLTYPAATLSANSRRK